MDGQAEKLLRQASQNQEIGNRRNAFSDLYRTVSGTGIVRLWTEILTCLRRFRTLRLILRIIGWLLRLLQAGTLIVLTTAVFFVILPLLGITALIASPIALSDRRRSKKRLSAALADSHGCVFFFTAGRMTYRTARELALDHGFAVLIVSPYWISPRRADGAAGRPYVNLRQESDGVFLIRRGFFFCAKSMALKHGITVVY